MRQKLGDLRPDLEVRTCKHIVDVDVERWVIIGMMVMCNDIAIIKYDKRRPRLHTTPLNMEYDNSSIENSPQNMKQ